MTDLEVLNLAAKAVGQAGDAWNPLADDVDAFRLMVALRLDVQFNADRVLVWRSGSYDPVIEEYRRDRSAATRRAIVKAAAEIGRESAQ